MEIDNNVRDVILMNVVKVLQDSILVRVVLVVLAHRGGAVYCQTLADVGI